MTLPERIIRKIEMPREADGCWRWTGCITNHGYGQVQDSRARKPRSAHRLVYELLTGPIPEGLGLDHLCRNRWCVRPDHLEPVTSRENTLRGETPAGRNARKTHCAKGHELTPENTLPDIRNARWRRCVTCQRYSAKTIAARRAATPLEPPKP